MLLEIKTYWLLYRSLLRMFKLILTNGVEDVEVFFKIRDTSIAIKWYLELCNNYQLYETNRFTNWGNTNIVDQLNQHIRIINQYDSIIDKELSNNPCQHDLNYLHKFFEDLRGDVVNGTTWFNNAPTTVKNSFEQFNILIHQLEADIRTKNHPTVVVTFKDRPKFNLEDDHLKYFTYRWTRGTVYINYCQVGKTVLDVIKDHDNLASGVRPQKYYSADFMIKFGPTIPYPVYILRKIYIQLRLAFLQFKFKNLNLGMIPVADMISNINIEDLKKFNQVKGVVCLK